MSDLLFIAASPYQDDVLNLPVKDLDIAIPFYEDFMGFQVLERTEDPHKRAILWQQDVKIGLAENGGNPEEERSTLLWISWRNWCPLNSRLDWRALKFPLIR